MGLFDVFKDKDEDSDNGEMTEEYRSEDTSSSFESEPEPVEETIGGSDTPAEETTSYAQPETAVQSQLGIEGLMDKRFKLGEAIDYVATMIKELRDKRTGLVKSIEDESVDIRNLKEKLTKINQFIQEENEGLQELTRKRTEVEKDADDVGNIVYGLRDKVSGIDKILDDEASRVKSFKDSKSRSA